MTSADASGWSRGEQRRERLVAETADARHPRTLTAPPVSTREGHVELAGLDAQHRRAQAAAVAAPELQMRRRLARGFEDTERR